MMREGGSFQRFMKKILVEQFRRALAQALFVKQKTHHIQGDTALTPQQITLPVLKPALKPKEIRLVEGFKDTSDVLVFHTIVSHENPKIVAGLALDQRLGTRLDYLIKPQSLSHFKNLRTLKPNLLLPSVQHKRFSFRTRHISCS